MNRKQQMWWLSGLTAATLVGQYIMLGNTGVGATPDQLPSWFWIAEKALWGLRALVEVGVVVYIGMTQTNDPRQKTLLWVFKGGLIMLIVATVGPIWAAHSLGETITTILGRGGVIAWGMLLAGISATMLAGVSYAYRVQPYDGGLIVLSPADHKILLDAVGRANADVGRLLVERDLMLVERASTL